jgi:hypothetical protein
VKPDTLSGFLFAALRVTVQHRLFARNPIGYRVFDMG